MGVAIGDWDNTTGEAPLLLLCPSMVDGKLRVLSGDDVDDREGGSEFRSGAIAAELPKVRRLLSRWLLFTECETTEKAASDDSSFDV
jgi:hypothetical protein